MNAWLRLHRNRIAVFALSALAGGCATLQEPLYGNLSSATREVRACAGWYRRLDQAVDAAGVRDAGSWRIPGFPYLRADRFLASFRDRVTGDERLFDAWRQRLRAQDVEARSFELRNLPESAWAELDVSGRGQAIGRSEECASALARHDLDDLPAGRKLLVDAAGVPDDYNDWQRVLGLYGLTRIPFEKGIERWQRDARLEFERSRSGSGPARQYRRFVPGRSIAAADGQVADIMRRLNFDALGVPRLSAADRETLFAAFAPVFEIEQGGAYDEFGALAWRESPAPGVDASNPVAYRRLAYTRYGDRTLLQLVYSIWFPERPHDGALDILAGPLDGVMVRVTLSPGGEPILYDSIHACGCYHMFFPTPRARPRPAPEPGEEWAFSPAAAPVLEPGQHVVIRLATRTHYLVDIATDAASSGGTEYGMRDEDNLRSLPIAGGGRRSIYGPDGLVGGTERSERLLFWPMGIASAGAMRQWGRHATAFVGRRHFDDADLIERRFAVDLR